MVFNLNKVSCSGGGFMAVGVSRFSWGRLSLSQVVKLKLLILIMIFLSTLNACDSTHAWERGALRERFMNRKSEPQNIAGLQDGSVRVAGAERTYSIYLPPAIRDRKGLSLVLAFHGTLGNGRKFAAQSNFSELAEQQGFIVVYPDAGGRQWNDGRFPTDPVDDVGYIRVLIADLEKRYSIDSRRIYATGASNGGLFTFRLACEMADEIAAFAPVIAALPVNLVSRCNPARPVPLLMINSDKDPFVPYGGGELFKGPGGKYGGGFVISVPQTVDFWVRRNGCALQPTENLLPDTDPDDETRVKRIQYHDCKSGSEIIQYIVQNGGHAWPGSPLPPASRRAGKSSRDINASEIIWRFFEKHSL